MLICMSVQLVSNSHSGQLHETREHLWKVYCQKYSGRGQGRAAHEKTTNQFHSEHDSEMNSIFINNNYYLTYINL